MKKTKCFTLAEILIVIGVIGIVAAIIIPTIMAMYKDKVEKRQMQVTERKFIEGLSLLNSQESGLSHSYPTTKDFVDALSKYMKISQICDNAHLSDCFPYDEIYLADVDKSVKIKNLKTADFLQLNKEGFKDTASFMTANGVSFLISYKQDCLEDTDKPLSQIPECVAGFYDNNGANKPNKFGYSLDENGGIISSGDIKSFNGARLTRCIADIGGVCVAMPPFENQALNGSYWAYGKKMCEDAGLRLPNNEELLKIGASFFVNGQKNMNAFREEKALAFGLRPAYPTTCNLNPPPKMYGLWSSQSNASNDWFKHYLIIGDWNVYAIGDYSCSIAQGKNYWQTICVSD